MAAESMQLTHIRILKHNPFLMIDYILYFLLLVVYKFYIQ